MVEWGTTHSVETEQHMTRTFEDCWFLTGPTASGKTSIAIELAAKIDAEIVSMDSMAVYCGMDIGTAKPTAEQQRQIPHHLIDILEPREEFSLANYLDRAEVCVGKIREAGHNVLFVGGTPLYLKSMLRGIFDGPAADWDFRNEVKNEVEQVGVQALHNRLAQVDPLSASRLPATDVRRIVRALEVYKITGKPISHMQMQFDEGRTADECRVFVLDWPRPILHQRIECRVQDMFARGLVEEVHGLQLRFGKLGRTAAQAVGYREVLEFLDSIADNTLEPTLSSPIPAELIERVTVRTRRFAKRQGTWFRALSECRVIQRQRDDDALEIAERIASS